MDPITFFNASSESFGGKPQSIVKLTSETQKSVLFLKLIILLFPEVFILQLNLPKHVSRRKKKRGKILALFCKTASATQSII